MTQPPDPRRERVAVRANQLRIISNALFLVAWILLVAAVLAGSWRIAGVGLLTFLPAGALSIASISLRKILEKA